MLEIETRIAAWRRNLTDASGLPAEVVEELENHLREDLAALVGAGVAEVEAFDRAVARLGTREALRAEFDKLAVGRVQPWLPARVATALCGVATAGLSLALAPRLTTGRIGLLLFCHILSITYGYLTMLSVGGLSMCYLGRRPFADLRPLRRPWVARALGWHARVAAGLTAVGVLLGMVWAKGHLGRYWGWDLKESGALLVLISAAAVAVGAWRRPDHLASVASAGIVGSFATGWAWFGFQMLAAGPPAYGLASGWRAVIIALGVLHVLFLGVALIPANSLLRREA